MAQAIASGSHLHGKGHANRGVFYSAEVHVEDLQTEELPLLLETHSEDPGYC